MELPPVYILKSINPIEIIGEADKETTEYVAKIIRNNKFIEFWKYICNLSPRLPLDIKQFEGQNLNDIEFMKNEFMSLPLNFSADFILNEVGLSKDFHIQIFLLIYFNSFISLKYFEGFVPKDIEFVTGKKNIVNIVMDSKYELCAILLPFTTSQRGINNYVKENWEAMEEQMQANLTQNPYIKRLHQNTEIAMEIHS